MNTTTTAKNTKKKTAPLSAPIAEVHLIPIELIDTAPQIRTEFDEVSIQELAKDIELRGMMQPVLLNPTGDRFTIIAGERRLRAIKLNGQAAIPALITKAGDQDALLMQLAENVQRDNLSLTDESNAIAKLYSMLGSLAAVSDKVRKSVPWCAKRYALAQDDFDWRARRLLEEGITEDIELLKAYSDLITIVGWPECDKWEAKMRAGELDRAKMRAALKTAKANKKKQQEQITENVSHAKTKEHTPPAPPAWNLDAELIDIDDALNGYNDKPAIDIYNSWNDDNRTTFNERLAERWREGSQYGQDDFGFKNIRNAVFKPFHETHLCDIEIMAMIDGYAGKERTVIELLEALQEKKAD